MDDFQTTTTKGGKQQAKKPFETPLPSVLDEQREQNKKKKKEANKFFYGGAANEEDAKVEEVPKQVAPAKMVEEPTTGAGGSGSDSEGEAKASGSKKHQQKMAERNKNKGGKKGGGKGGANRKKAAAESEDEQADEDEEEKKEEVKPKKAAGEREPIEVVYCKICGIPPEYCMFEKKDSSECKAWVRATHPELFEKIYGETIVKDEEGKEEIKEGEEQQQQKKKKKKSLAFTCDTDIKVYKAKRGGKKMICSVVGLQNYGVPMKDIAKLMGKKFACGCAVAEDDKYGECIQIQGDVQERFMDFVEQELTKYKITVDRIKFEEVKKKKKAEGAAAAEDGDDQE